MLSAQKVWEATALMLDPEFKPAVRAAGVQVQRVDGAQQYRQFIEQKSKVFDLTAIRSWLVRNRQELFILIDNMHGASRGYIETILGDETMIGAIAFRRHEALVHQRHADIGPV